MISLKSHNESAVTGATEWPTFTDDLLCTRDGASPSWFHLTGTLRSGCHYPPLWVRKYSPVICSHCLVTKSCQTCDAPWTFSSVQGISQARILEWVAISFSGDLPSTGIKSASPTLAGGFFTTESCCMCCVCGTLCVQCVWCMWYVVCWMCVYCVCVWCATCVCCVWYVWRDVCVCEMCCVCILCCMCSVLCVWCSVCMMCCVCGMCVLCVVCVLYVASVVCVLCCVYVMCVVCVWCGVCGICDMLCVVCVCVVYVCDVVYVCMCGVCDMCVWYGVCDVWCVYVYICGVCVYVHGLIWCSQQPLEEAPHCSRFTPGGNRVPERKQCAQLTEQVTQLKCEAQKSVPRDHLSPEGGWSSSSCLCRARSQPKPVTLKARVSRHAHSPPAPPGVWPCRGPWGQPGHCRGFPTAEPSRVALTNPAELGPAGAVGAALRINGKARGLFLPGRQPGPWDGQNNCQMGYWMSACSSDEHLRARFPCQAQRDSQSSLLWGRSPNRSF